MQTKKEVTFNGDIYKPKRSISSQIGNDNVEENLNEKKLKSRHRKTASSYFLGSYISGNDLNKFLQEYKENSTENINSDKNVQYENDIYKGKNLNNKKKCEMDYLDNLLRSKDNNLKKEKDNINENLVCLTNASFYSYSIDDNNDNKCKENGEEDNSVIIKGKNDSSSNNNETKSDSYIGNISNFFSNPFYELEKNNEKYNKDKSFIPIKNGLKYMKDKDERVTESYLLALNGGESNIKLNKNPYLSTASIIEEEKSEFIESTSKKKSIIAGNRFLKDINFNKKKIESEFNLVKNEEDNILEKTEDDENKENIDLNSNKNSKDKNEINKKNSKNEIDISLNKIKLQKNKKIEKKKKYIRKNKENLLNSFFNLSYNRSIPNQNNYEQEENGNKTNTNNNTTKNDNRINNKNILNNNFKNFHFIIKDKNNQELIKNKDKPKTNLNNKKKRTYSYNGGYISYLYNQRFKTENGENNNNKQNENIKFNISKCFNQKQNKNIIYTSYNNIAKENPIMKNKINKIMNKSHLSKIKLNPNMKIPHNKFDKSKIQLISKKCPFNKNVNNGSITSKMTKLDNKLILDWSNHRKSFSITKVNIDKIQKHRKILSSGGFDNKIRPINSNINRSVTFKKVKIDTNRIEKNFEKSNYSQILSHRNKPIINNSKDNIRLPTYSDSCTSRVKQKIKFRIINGYGYKNKKIISNIRKANSGFIKVKLDSDIQNKGELNINISNKSQTLIILNDKVKFFNINEKSEVFNIIKNDFRTGKNIFIIFCEKSKEKNNNEFFFLGLFKYFENNKRFIKVFGNEEIPNYILLKNINKENYIIYENKIIQNEENQIQFLFEQLNKFYFSFNSFIICKK